MWGMLVFSLLSPSASFTHHEHFGNASVSTSNYHLCLLNSFVIASSQLVMDVSPIHALLIKSQSGKSWKRVNGSSILPSTNDYLEVLFADICDINPFMLEFSADKLKDLMRQQNISFIYAVLSGPSQLGCLEETDFMVQSTINSNMQENPMESFVDHNFAALYSDSSAVSKWIADPTWLKSSAPFSRAVYSERFSTFGSIYYFSQTKNLHVHLFGGIGFLAIGKLGQVSVVSAVEDRYNYFECKKSDLALAIIFKYPSTSNLSGIKDKASFLNFISSQDHISVLL